MIACIPEFRVVYENLEAECAAGSCGATTSEAGRARQPMAAVAAVGALAFCGHRAIRARRCCGPRTRPEAASGRANLTEASTGARRRG
uniref:Uncharacterized protein n=1 Tax=Arundo donax TaxID=35708 RepID=A0A0A8YA20_ARUDO